MADTTRGDHGESTSANFTAEVPFAVDDIKNAACRVDRVVISGLKRTKEEVVKRELQNLHTARSLHEIAAILNDAHRRLEALDAFQAVEVIIDESSKSREHCTVLVRVHESSLFTMHTGIYVQGTEDTVEASLNLNNPFGYTDQVSIGVEHGTKHTNVYSVTYTLPKPLGRPVIADVRLHQLFSDREPWSSYVERLRGLIATIASEDGRHACSYEVGWQRLTNPSRRASKAVIPYLGDYMKHAVKYTFSAHAFDDFAFPRNGWGVRTSSEIAALGIGDNLQSFTKHQVVGRLAFPLSQEAALHIEATAGVLLPWSTGAQGYSISDKFFLGGLGGDGLRGFCYRGLGPVDLRRPPESGDSQLPGSRNADALGGNAMCSLLAALRFNLPLESAQAVGLRGQVFVNCGSLGELTTMRHDFAKSIRCSVGAGIVWPTGIGNLELNVCRVLKRAASDQVKHGIQFGITPST